MDFSVNELNSQMSQHLFDPFGICQGRIHYPWGWGCNNILAATSACVHAPLGPSQVYLLVYRLK